MKVGNAAITIPIHGNGPASVICPSESVQPRCPSGSR